MSTLETEYPKKVENVAFLAQYDSDCFLFCFFCQKYTALNAIVLI